LPARSSDRAQGRDHAGEASTQDLVRCSEEGLEQEFNSLQAQREACEAFIDSQRHEGWVCLRSAYDDGGFSGATMDRPALQQLLADITAGRIDTVVVYKIDRLTRSLADFAKIVEILDAKGASFVSVTQQFNTTTSMGRLTLNGSIGAPFQRVGSFNNSTWYLLPLRVAPMSRNIDRKRVATWSSKRRPKGQVPVVSISIEFTFGMKMSTGRRSGIGNPFLFQESSGMLSS
jgi:Resolvase, N terminal domain